MGAETAGRGPEPHVLVLGIGNILMQDEGLGVRAVERLKERYHLPPEVRATDGGVMGLDLLPYLEDAERVLILDAVQTGRPPGTLVRLEGQDIPVTLALKTSIHQVGLQEVLAVGRFRGTLPNRITLWGVEPAAVEIGTDLSPVVSAALDDLAEAVAEEEGWRRLERLDCG
jgi:hydrogenase maturation protease